MTALDIPAMCHARGVQLVAAAGNRLIQRRKRIAHTAFAGGSQHGQGFGVGGALIAGAAQVLEVGVLGAHPRVVQPRGDRVGLDRLAVLPRTIGQPIGGNVAAEIARGPRPLGQAALWETDVTVYVARRVSGCMGGTL